MMMLPHLIRLSCIRSTHKIHILCIFFPFRVWIIFLDRQLYNPVIWHGVSWFGRALLWENLQTPGWAPSPTLFLFFFFVKLVWIKLTFIKIIFYNIDFLPMRCDACQDIFCKDHITYANHKCTSAYKKASSHWWRPKHLFYCTLITCYTIAFLIDNMTFLVGCAGPSLPVM